jgi:hypothetical protein
VQRACQLRLLCPPTSGPTRLAFTKIAGFNHPTSPALQGSAPAHQPPTGHSHACGERGLTLLCVIHASLGGSAVPVWWLGHWSWLSTAPATPGCCVRHVHHKVLGRRTPSQQPCNASHHCLLVSVFSDCSRIVWKTPQPGSKQTFRAFQWHFLFPCCCRVVALAVPAAVRGAAGAVSSRKDMRCRLLVAWHTQDLPQATAEPSAVPSVSGTQHHAS